MAIVYQKDNRVGITYAYYSESWWDKEKHQSRSRRKLIGRVDDNGQIVPTSRRRRKSDVPSDDHNNDLNVFYSLKAELESMNEKIVELKNANAEMELKLRKYREVVSSITTALGHLNET